MKGVEGFKIMIMKSFHNEIFIDFKDLWGWSSSNCCSAHRYRLLGLLIKADRFVI